MSSRRILLSTRSVLSRYSRAINSCDGPSFPSSHTSSIYYHRQQSIRGFGSTFPVFKGAEAEDASVAAAEGAADRAEETEEDECPVWQNPLHHNNPEFKKVLADDFAPGEEMPVVPLPPFSSDDSSVEAPPHIHDLANQIIALNLMELAALMDRIGEHFGFDDSADFGGDDGGDGGDGGSGAEVVQEEKTVFDLKLEGFDAKSKIKVIKEIRTVTGLGLKEAKELVEGAPTTIKKDIKMEEAEELKAKLEAAGATVSIA